MKNIMKHTKIGASLIALAFSLFVTHNAQAQSCATPPSCTELGYTRSASDCATIALKCPFDQTKYYCLTADELADIGGGGSCDNPNVGSILYSDMSCSSSLDTTKTPIGVIFNPTFRLAIALNTTTAYWSTTYFDVPNLTNYSSSDSAKNDWAGKSNTNIVVSYCAANSKSCPAFDYVSSYKTAETNAGDWYLPAMGEVNNIYENMAVLNRTLSLIGGTQLPTGYHWSSSETSGNGAWGQTFDNGGIYGSNKGANLNYVRPVLAF